MQSIIEFSIIFGLNKIGKIIFYSIFKKIISLLKQIFFLFELIEVTIFSLYYRA